ncbi:uncharacterized protein LOC122509558 [Leptopilina heterotoma]|uniref:uncharacterized protein LOC122509558 n=1 Tax=Leptopilina heterotoma TaxID=63436 RepID=UPI001CA8CE0B|nr:uncharacterized protein LOC122509558 [Leptopilina heterotoma]
MSLTMGKIMKKQPPKKYGISSRRFRKIVQERLLNDCNLVQSQHSSSTPLETSIGEVSNISSLLPNVELPTFIDSEPPSKLCNVNIDLNLCSSSFSDNNEISNAPCIENEPCEMESNVSDNDSEITCNEDTRKTDSDLGEDDLELSDFLYRDETP